MGAARNATWTGMNWIRKDLRLAIYLRDGFSCMWCGSAVEDGVGLELDHLTPHSKGGKNDPTNLVCSCKKCNASRGDRSIQMFAKAAAGYINHGVTSRQILSAIKSHAAKDIKPFRDEAKAILARRPGWQAAVKSAQTSNAS